MTILPADLVDSDASIAFPIVTPIRSMQRHLDLELDALRDLLLKMADIVDEQFADAMNALLNRDLDLARQVMNRDSEVDRMEMDVDRQCERIMALYQPVSRDLRMLIMAVKITTDLERIGDHCKNLAKNVAYLADLPELLPRTHLREMADEARAMLRDVQDAFVKQDAMKARRVLAQDRKVDRLHEDNFYMMVDLGKSDPELVEAMAHLVTMSKGLERISDHATNIAEGVIFLIEGIDVRHSKARRVEQEN
jgi:phosphate transport system protein